MLHRGRVELTVQLLACKKQVHQLVVASLSELFELSDNELMDLLLARKELDGVMSVPSNAD